MKKKILIKVGAKVSAQSRTRTAVMPKNYLLLKLIIFVNLFLIAAFAQGDKSTRVAKLAPKPSVTAIGHQGQSIEERVFPEFSWDKIPLYIHVRKMTDFTPEEVKYLASFPLITFEKTTGREQYGSTDAGTLKAAEKVKEVNPAARILFYRNVLVHFGGYSFDKDLDNIERPFLRDRHGKEKVLWGGRADAFDLSQKIVRDWWIDSLDEVCASDYIDGLFIDGNVKVLSKYLKRQLPSGKKEALIKGYHDMMSAMRNKMDPRKLLLGNIIRARFARGGNEYMHYFDGSYLEAFTHNVGGETRKNYILKGI
ncbi:MAG: hypothetical protein HRT88_01680, partial [Lentisphaeraceae bacterium]|nr:hypothetical protein [Lentisphaeraceae bacterium]